MPKTKPAPLTLHHVSTVSRLLAAEVAIDTLQRFVGRWLVDRRAMEGLRIPVDEGVDADKAGRLGVVSQNARAQATVADLVVQADGLADALKHMRRVTKPSQGRAGFREAHVREFERAVCATGSDGEAIWSFVARFFVNLTPLTLETHKEQHVSALKAYFGRQRVPMLDPERLADALDCIVLPSRRQDDTSEGGMEQDTPDEPDEPEERETPLGGAGSESGAGVSSPKVFTLPERISTPGVPEAVPPVQPLSASTDSETDHAAPSDVQSPATPHPPRPDPVSPAQVDTEMRLILDASSPEVTGKPPPEFLMGHFNQHDFSAIMGVKQGPLVWLGIRTDAKADMLKCLKEFNEETAAAQRRDALLSMLPHCERYIVENKDKERKRGRVEFVVALKEAAEWEQDLRHGLSRRQDTSSWETSPKVSAASGVLSALMALDANAARVEELSGFGDQPAEATKSKATLEATAASVSSDAGQGKLRSLRDLLQAVQGAVSMETLSKVAECYFDFLQFFDFSGIGKLLNALQAFRDHRRTKKRLAALAKFKDSRDWFSQEFVGYATAKLTRRNRSSIFLGVTNFIGGLSRLITLLSGGAAAIVTEVMGLSVAILGALHELARDAKGIYKHLLGTRGVARKTRAALLIWRASLDGEGRGLPDLTVLAKIRDGDVKAAEAVEMGRCLVEVTRCLADGSKATRLRTRLGTPAPTEAILLLKDFLEPDFVSGLPLLKEAYKAMWDKLWAAGHEGVRLLLALCINIVKSDTSLMEVLRTAAKKNPEELKIYLLAARISLWVQSLLFEALSSRPKLGSSSWIGNRRDDFIKEMLVA